MKYCDAIDCAFCLENEPCIYIIANKLEEENEELRKLAEDKEVSGVVVVNEENKGQEGVDTRIPGYGSL